MGVTQVTPEPCEECGNEIASVIDHEESCDVGKESAEFHIEQMTAAAGTDAHLPVFAELVHDLCKHFEFTDEYGNPKVSL